MVMPGVHLCAVEPKAAQAVEDFGLQEADPARVQVHDDGKWGVGREDDVVDHGRVVAHPDVVGPVDWTRPVIPAGEVPESPWCVSSIAILRLYSKASRPISAPGLQLHPQGALLPRGLVLRGQSSSTFLIHLIAEVARP